MGYYLRDFRADRLRFPGGSSAWALGPAGDVARSAFFEPSGASTIVEADFNSNGVGTPNFNANQIKPTALSAVGAGVAAFVGGSALGGALVATGVGTAAFVATRLRATVAGMTGVGTASFVSLATRGGALSAPGTSPTTFLGQSRRLSTWTAAGVGAFAAAGEAITPPPPLVEWPEHAGARILTFEHLLGEYNPPPPEADLTATGSSPVTLISAAVALTNLNAAGSASAITFNTARKRTTALSAGGTCTVTLNGAARTAAALSAAGLGLAAFDTQTRTRLMANLTVAGVSTVTFDGFARGPVPADFAMAGTSSLVMYIEARVIIFTPAPNQYVVPPLSRASVVAAEVRKIAPDGIDRTYVVPAPQREEVV